MEKDKKHIIFIIPSLAAGGAERIFSFVSQKLNKEKFKVELLVIGSALDSVYPIDNVETIYLNKPKISKAFLKIIKVFKSKKPDIVLSSIAHLNSMMAGISILFPNIKFVAREANVISVLDQYNKSNVLPKSVIVKTNRFIDRFIAQSKDMKEDMIKNFGIPEDKIELINNPITSKISLKKSTVHSPLKFITVGRLSKEKGHDRILRALAQLNFPFSYTIIGDGNEAKNVFALAKELNIQNINHIPFTSDVGKELGNHDIFLQGSYVEGFPNVLLESCMAGTPIIAFKAPGGLNEIIEPNINGLIAQNEDEFITHLNHINQVFPFEAEEVRKIVLDRFNEDKIISQYENLLLNL